MTGLINVEKINLFMKVEKMFLQLEAKAVDDSPFKQKVQDSGLSQAAYFLLFRN